MVQIAASQVSGEGLLCFVFEVDDLFGDGCWLLAVCVCECEGVVVW